MRLHLAERQKLGSCHLLINRLGQSFLGLKVIVERHRGDISLDSHIIDADIGRSVTPEQTPRSFQKPITTAGTADLTCYVFHFETRFDKMPH